MKKVMNTIDELLREFRVNPAREMRCGSVSCRDRVLFSYALPIARHLSATNQFYALHEAQSSPTTNRHIRQFKWWVATRSTIPYREVPSLYASEDEIREYFTAKLNRVLERYSRSNYIPTAFEYFRTHYDYARYTDGLPEIPSKIRVLAELEGWYAG